VATGGGFLATWEEPWAPRRGMGSLWRGVGPTERDMGCLIRAFWPMGRSVWPLEMAVMQQRGV
jgi:hypothetical protein